VVIDVLAEALRRPELVALPDDRLALLAIAARRLINASRRGGNVDPVLPPDALLDDAERVPELDRHALEARLAGLPVRQRVVVALRHVAGLSVDGIATVMRMQRSVAEAELAAARTALLAAIERPDALSLEIIEVIS
jgi:DNA-directed RNA polymerase specialized sigma24 family protein